MPKQLRGTKFAHLESNAQFITALKEHLPRFTAATTYYDTAKVTTMETKNNALKALINAPALNAQRMSTQEYNKLEKDTIDQAWELGEIIKVVLGKEKDKEKGNVFLTNFKLKKSVKTLSKPEFAEAMDTLLNTMPTYKAELVAAKIPATKIDNLVKLATTYRSAYTTQGLSKTKSSSFTTEQNNDLLDLYEDILLAKKLAFVIFRDEPEIKRKFDFNRILSENTTKRPRKTTNTTDITPVE